MSRIPLHRALVLSTLLAGLALSCSDPTTAPPARSSAALLHSDIPLALSSPGWQEEARALITAKVPNAYVAGRVLAVLSIAQYLAVTEVDRHFDVDAEDFMTSHGLGAGGRALLEARRGAVAGASDSVLNYFFGKDAQTRERLANLVLADAGPGKAHPQFKVGEAIGRAASEALVVRASKDHFDDAWQGAVAAGYAQPGDGQWFGPNPPNGYMLVLTTPYLLTSRDQFRTSIPEPPSITSDAFRQGLDEIRTIALHRTPAERDIAILWNLPAGGANPTISAPGWWNSTAANYIAEYGMDERQATRVFALTQTAVADAQIACWDTKFTYWTLRPTQAEALIYGDRVIADRLVLSVPTHPSYPSGHSCLSSAAARVLSHFFGLRAHDVDETVAAMGLSRMYAGIHYRFDVEAAKALGDMVADWAIGRDESVGLLAALNWVP